MSAPQLIGLGVPKEHGKDAFAGFLASHIGQDAVVIGMSDALIESLLVIDPLVVVAHENGVTLPDGTTLSGLMLVSRVVQLAGYVEAKKVPKVRTMLQALGTDVVRYHCDDAWVNEARRRIHDHRLSGRPVIITGIRTPGELSLIATLGGSAFWVERPGHPISAGSAHSIEHALTAEDFDEVVLNDSTLTALDDKAKQLVAVSPVLAAAGASS